MQVTVNRPAAAEQEPLLDIHRRILKRFEVLELVGSGVVKGDIRALIVSGAAGCGKTYTLESLLKAAKASEEISYEKVSGSMSGIGLYRQLWYNRDAGNVLLIDDCDSIFADLDAVNLLKSALDTNLTRQVHWNKESRVLAEEGIDRQFEFDGSVVFITNIDFNREIEAGKKMSPHYNALVSRCLYFDLGIHSKREVLVRVGQVVRSKQFMSNNGITEAQGQAILGWIAPNINRIQALSVRTVLHLARLIKTSPTTWESLADILLIKTK